MDSNRFSDAVGGVINGYFLAMHGKCGQDDVVLTTFHLSSNSALSNLYSYDNTGLQVKNCMELLAIHFLIGFNLV